MRSEKQILISAVRVCSFALTAEIDVPASAAKLWPRSGTRPSAPCPPRPAPAGSRPPFAAVRSDRQRELFPGPRREERGTACRNGPGHGLCRNRVACLWFFVISDIRDEQKGDVTDLPQKSKAAEGFPLRLSCSDLNKSFKNSSFGMHDLIDFKSL